MPGSERVHRDALPRARRGTPCAARMPDGERRVGGSRDHGLPQSRPAGRRRAIPSRSAAHRARPQNAAEFLGREMTMKQITVAEAIQRTVDRKSTRLNSSHLVISYAVFCLKKKKK